MNQHFLFVLVMVILVGLMIGTYLPVFLKPKNIYIILYRGDPIIAFRDADTAAWYLEERRHYDKECQMHREDWKDYQMRETRLR